MKPKDVKKFLRDLARISNNQISVDFFDDSNFNVFYLKVTPCKGMYAHASFRFKIDMNVLEDSNYPDVTCITSIYHPNIDPTLGLNVCINLLNSWNKNTSLTDLTNSILYLFYEPNFADPIYDIFVPPDFDSFQKLVRASLMGCKIGKYKYEANHDWIEWCKKNEPDNLIPINPLDITEKYSEKTLEFMEKTRDETGPQTTDSQEQKDESQKDLNSNIIFNRSSSHYSDFYTSLVNPHIERAESVSSKKSNNAHTPSESDSLAALYVSISMEKVYTTWIAEDRLNDEKSYRNTYYFILPYELTYIADTFKDDLFIPIDTKTNSLRTIQTGSHVGWYVKCHRDLLGDDWETISETSIIDNDDIEVETMDESLHNDNDEISYECQMQSSSSNSINTLDYRDDDDDDPDDGDQVSKKSELHVAEKTIKLLSTYIKPKNWFLYQTYFIPDLLPEAAITISRLKALKFSSSTFYKRQAIDFERIIQRALSTKDCQHVIVADAASVWPTSPNIMHLHYNSEIRQNQDVSISNSLKTERGYRVIEWISPTNSYLRNSQLDHLRVSNITLLSYLVNISNFFSWLHRLELHRYNGVLWSEQRSSLQSIFVRGNIGAFFTPLDIWPTFLLKEGSRKITRLFASYFCRSQTNERIQFGFVNTSLNSNIHQRFA